MRAVRATGILGLLLALGPAGPVGAAELAYRQVSAGAPNNATDVNAGSCNATDGCFAAGGLPCKDNPNQRCAYQRVPAGRCAGGSGSCIWPLGGGTCVSNGAVACLADPPNDAQTDDNGGVGYPSAMCADLATEGCDMTGNDNACTCQGDDPSAGDWEGTICSGVSADSQARCSDGDPFGAVGGLGAAFCTIIEVGLAEQNCGSESVTNLARDGPRYPYENPPNLITPQRLPGKVPATPGTPIVDQFTSGVIDLDAHGSGPYAAVGGRLFEILGDSQHGDWPFQSGAITGSLDANIPTFSCDPPGLWAVNRPVEGVCEPLSGSFGGEFCIKDTDCPGNGSEGDTCTPLAYCHEATINGYGHLWERNLTAAEQTAHPTCPPTCGKAADFHTGEIEAFVSAQAVSVRGAAQLALDRMQGARAGEGNLHVVGAIVNHSWVASGDNRCFIGGNPDVTGDTDGDGVSNVDTCDLLSFVCGDGITPCSGPNECPDKRGRCDDGTGRSCDFAVGGASECGAGIACRPCGGTLGNRGCTGAGTPLACCTGVDSGSCETTGPGGNCVDCEFTDAAKGNPFALPIAFNDHGLPQVRVLGRIGGLADKDSAIHIPVITVVTNGPARSQFRDDTCQPQGQADTCKLGQDSGPLLSGVGTGGVFLSSFVPPIDPLGGPLGVEVTWDPEGTGSTCTGCLVARDYAPGPDGIPGCLGDNEPANGTLVPCDLVLGGTTSGSTGTDDPELTADFGTAASPDIRNATLARFLVSDPTRKTPVVNATTAITLRDLNLFVDDNVDVVVKANITWCPFLGSCSLTAAQDCQSSADCPATESCENIAVSCERQPYCSQFCGDTRKFCSGNPGAYCHHDSDCPETQICVDLGTTDADNLLCVSEDPCPDFTNTLPINGGTDCQTTAQDGDPIDPNADCNGDGIPNECQCGDINLNGLIDLQDAIFAFNCQEPPNLPASICGPPQAAGIGDANANGIYDTQDALFVFNSQPGKVFGTSFLTCANRPPRFTGPPSNPGPPVQNNPPACDGP